MHADEFLARLSQWSSETAAASAAGQRRRRHALVRQAGAEATLAGLVQDWAERRATVVVRVRSGHAVAGAVAVVGRDFMAVTSVAGTTALSLVPLAAVVTVLPAAGAAGAGPGAGAGASAGAGPARIAPSVASLAGVLAELAADHQPVSVRVAGWPEPVRGELHAAGEDVLGVRVDIADRPLAYVPLAAVCEVAVL
jgi:hypothetical protein